MKSMNRKRESPAPPTRRRVRRRMEGSNPGQHASPRRGRHVSPLAEARIRKRGRQGGAEENLIPCGQHVAPRLGEPIAPMQTPSTSRPYVGRHVSPHAREELATPTSQTLDYRTPFRVIQPVKSPHKSDSIAPSTSSPATSTVRSQKTEDRRRRMSKVGDETLHPYFIATRKAIAVTRDNISEETRNQLRRTYNGREMTSSIDVIPFVIDASRRPKINTIIAYDSKMMESLSRLYWRSTVHTFFDDDFNIYSLCQFLNSGPTIESFECVNIDFKNLLVIYFFRFSEIQAENVMEQIEIAFCIAKVEGIRLIMIVRGECETSIPEEIENLHFRMENFLILFKEDYAATSSHSLNHLPITRLIYTDLLLCQRAPSHRLAVDQKLIVDVLLQAQTLEITDTNTPALEKVTDMRVSFAFAQSDQLLNEIHTIWSDIKANFNPESEWPTLDISSPSQTYHQSVERILCDIKVSYANQDNRNFKERLFAEKNLPNIYSRGAIWLLAIYLTKEPMLQIPMSHDTRTALTKRTKDAHTSDTDAKMTLMIALKGLRLYECFYDTFTRRLNNLRRHCPISNRMPTIQFLRLKNEVVTQREVLMQITREASYAEVTSWDSELATKMILATQSIVSGPALQLLAEN